MKFTLLQLVGAGSVLVALMTVGAIMVMRGERLDKRIAGRFALTVTPYSRAAVVATTERRQEAAPPAATRLLRRIAGVVGYDPTRADQVPYPVMAVLAAALVAGVGLSMLASLLLGPRTVLLSPVMSIVVSRMLFGSFAASRAAKLYVQFPDALSMIVRTVRVGIPVSEGIRVVSREAPVPTATEFSRLADQVSIGVALEDALRDLAARTGLPEYRFFATALALQAQTGGGLSETLDNLAEVIRKRVAMRSRAQALASEAKTSTYILAALPVVTGGLLGVINPTYIGVLFTESAGNKPLGAAIGMLAVGMGVMRFIIAKALK